MTLGHWHWLPLASALLGAVACGDRDRPKVEETERHSRVVDPPAKEVRALPPHAIHADGVGPYKIGASLSDLNDLLRSGPHLAQVDIPNVIRVSVLRAEDGAIQIGGEPRGKAAFVSVVGGQVARTESGVHVGSTRDELTHALGAPAVELERARDPQIVVLSGMPELRAVLVHDRVAGLVVAPHTAKDAKDSRDGRDADACPRPADPSPEPARGQRFGACLSGTPDWVTVEGDELSIRTQDDKPLASVRIPGIAFAGALRGPDARDGRDELYVVTSADEPTQRTWSVAGYRLEGTHLVRVVDQTPAYQLTAASAHWLGADLHDLDLLLELSMRPDGVEVGGLLVTRVGDKLRDLLVVAPIQVPRKRAKSAASEPPTGGTTDAAAPAPDAGP